MKKLLKIVGATLGSLVALVLVVAVVLVYVVFTPERLTPIVDKVAGDYIGCDYEIGQVDLTFFSTFPEFGLRADGLLIVNPTEGAQSDTLLEAKTVVARIDIMELLQNGMIDIHELALRQLTANAYMAADGRTNFDILTLSPDTTETDTTSESFIKGVKMTNLYVLLETNAVSLVDEPDRISAEFGHAEIALDAAGLADGWTKGHLSAKLPSLSAEYKGTNYATDADIAFATDYRMLLDMPELGDIQGLTLELTDGKLSLNEFEVRLSGHADVLPSIDLNMDLSTNRWHISDVLALVPASIFEMPKDIRADGDLQLDAKVVGAYNDSTMPLVDAHIVLTDATGEYIELPYVLEDVQGVVDAHLDLNDEKACSAIIRSLSANTKQSSLAAEGRVDDLLNSMLMDLKLHVDLHLPDAAYFLPENMTAKGHAKGDIAARITLDDLSALRLAKGKISADIDFGKLDVVMDSMLINASAGNLSFRIPAAAKKAESAKEEHRLKNLSWLDGTLNLKKLHVEEPGNLAADLGETSLALRVNDILNDAEVIYADVDLSTSSLNASLDMTDSLGQVSKAVVAADKPDICAYVEYDMKDSLKIPTLDCEFALGKLVADYDTIHAHICDPEGEVVITGGRRDKTQPVIIAKLKATDVDAQMGQELAAETGKFSMRISARHTDNKKNILLEWQPKLDFDLNKATVKMAALDPKVILPEIKFSYSNSHFLIDTARVELGSSNFSLSGDVYNIGPWLDDKGLLMGKLNFYSTHTDVNELLGYVSGMGSDEETTEAAPAAESTQAAAASESDPFIVPKGVDLTLNTHIREAIAFDQQLRNLGGRVYVRDGVLIIEEMGFICQAAKLQLTAMYETPRRNHIFAGFDYHMTDINVEELVNMIPQVDSMLPMLRSFKGAANFHLAAETYLNSQYEIKPSTTRGACSIDAKDLTLLDGETFTKIAKILTFNKKTENKIDSISAEISLYKQQVDIYPFLITCDKWMGAVGGQHNLDMTFNYHASLLSPLYIGVDVTGTFDDMKIKPAKCRYAKDFKPVFSKQVDTEAADIRKMIKQAIEKNLNK